MVAVANVRVNTQVPFPAFVQGAGGITVTKVNGVWTIGPQSGTVAATNTQNNWTQLQTFSAGLYATAIKTGPSIPQIPNQSTGEFYYDNTNTFAEHGSALNLVCDLGAAAPPGLVPVESIYGFSQGNNTTFIGQCGLFISTSDRATVNSSNKGVLYGMLININPSVTRNNSPFDDATGLVITNQGTAKGADAFYVGQGTGMAGHQWGNIIALQGQADTMLLSNGTYTTGIDLSLATISGSAIHTSGFTVTSVGTVVANGLQSQNYLFTAAPVTLNGTSGTATLTNPSTIIASTGAFTLTLPTPSGNAGAWMWLKTTAAHAVTSASSNVVPLGSSAAGSAIFSGTVATDWAILQSDGTNWIMMAGFTT